LDAPGSRIVELSVGAGESDHPEELPVAAARCFDESQGRYYWEYRFTPFGPRDRRDGYDVFVCRYGSDEAAKDRLNDFGLVVTECLYAGYVRCLPPTILIDSREELARASSDCGCFPINVLA
jgi:hypothetical protein